MEAHEIVSREAWLEARKALLAKEKEFTRLRDALSAERRALPWVKVEKTYVFEGPEGRQTLGDLFDGRSQLIVYHFMFGPDWTEGCKSCSYLADHFDGAALHLAQRDARLVVISRGPLARLEAFKRRMGWRFPWFSSLDSDFNFDFGVSFTAESMAAGHNSYNYAPRPKAEESEGPGVSVFYRDPAGDVFHTYSSYGRGLDILVGTYNFLDLAPKGRDEDALPWPMAWVRHHDRYAEAEAAAAAAP